MSDWRQHSFVADAGFQYPEPPGGDSFLRFIELMQAVERLCPAWPPRELAQSGDYRMSGKMHAPRPQPDAPTQPSPLDAALPVPTDRLFL